MSDLRYIMNVERLRSRIEQFHPRSLFVVGTGDKYYIPEVLQRLETATNGNAS